MKLRMYSVFKIFWKSSLFLLQFLFAIILSLEIGEVLHILQINFLDFTICLILFVIILIIEFYFDNIKIFYKKYGIFFINCFIFILIFLFISIIRFDSEFFKKNNIKNPNHYQIVKRFDKDQKIVEFTLLEINHLWKIENKDEKIFKYLNLKKDEFVEYFDFDADSMLSNISRM